MKITENDIDLSLMMLVYERAALDDELPISTQITAIEFLVKLLDRASMSNTAAVEIADAIEKRHLLDLRAKDLLKRIRPPKPTEYR